MSDVTFAVRMDLPREALAEERSVAAPGYELGQETALPPDPDALEAHFIEPVTLIATVTVAMLAWRIVNHFLVKDGRGVLIDARSQPPLVSRLEDVPAGFIVLVKADGSSEALAAGKTDDAALAELIGKVLGSS
jgi:hypothetical protein